MGKSLNKKLSSLISQLETSGNKQISFSVSEEEAARFESLAARRGGSVEQMLRSLVKAEAEKIAREAPVTWARGAPEQ